MIRRAMQPEGAPLQLPRRDLRNQRIARWRTQTLPDPVQHPKPHHLPRRAGYRHQGTHQNRRPVAEEDEGLLPSALVGQSTADPFGDRRGQVGRPVERPERGRRTTERADDVRRQERVHHLAREIVE